MLENIDGNLFKFNINSCDIYLNINDKLKIKFYNNNIKISNNALINELLINSNTNIKINIFNNNKILLEYNNRKYYNLDREYVSIITFDREYVHKLNEKDLYNFKQDCIRLYKLQSQIKIFNFYKKYKRNKILWKIAEYYMAKKYAPKNILKYINL
jgi:hypothetical protein